MKDYTTISIRLPTELLREIRTEAEIKTDKHPTVTFTATDIIVDWLYAASVILKNIHKIKEPQLVADLRKNTGRPTIVDYIATLSTQDQELLYSILSDELRSKKQKIK